MDAKANKYGEWISAINPPYTETEVLVELGHTYESEYTFYSIARYIRFDDGECHWCDNKYGYLEWGESIRMVEVAAHFIKCLDGRHCHN